MIQNKIVILSESEEIKVQKTSKQRQWSLEEERRYLQSLKKNLKLMKTYQSRKTNKVFKKISEDVFTRTSTQVKSHHQKLELKYRNSSGIIYHLEKRIIQKPEVKFQNSQSPKIDLNIETSSLVSLINCVSEEQVLPEKYQIYREDLFSGDGESNNWPWDIQMYYDHE